MQNEEFYSYIITSISYVRRDVRFVLDQYS